MSNPLNFSLPERPQEKKSPAKTLPMLLILVLLIGVANLVISLTRGGPKASQTTTAKGGFSAENRKQLALKLEKQELHHEAAAAWKDYLAADDLSSDESARIWYRIAKLQQQAKAYPQALHAYYRSESHATLPEIENEIDRRAQECLEAMGKYSAVRYELADRVGMGDNSNAAGEQVVAEIGTQTITRAQLDSLIEQQITQQLAQYASFMPEADRNKQKQALFEQFSTSEQRLRFLNQYLVEEMLQRRARETKLTTEQPEIVQMIRDQERKLLAQKMMEQTLSQQINITPGDLTTFFEANRKDYVQPERVQVSHILLADEPTADQVSKALDDGQDFGELAREHSLDAATKDKAGAIAGWVTRDQPIPGIGALPQAMDSIFNTAAGKVADATVKSDKGYHIFRVRDRQPEQQQELDAVRNEVYRSLRSRKEREVQEQMLSALRDRYDVVIHQSAFPADETPQEK